MQRCPYIHEMRERLLGEPTRESYNLDTMERDGLIDNRQSAASDQVGTVVKLHADGYHTSPAHQRTPLVPRDLGEDFNLDFDEDFLPLDNKRPKNAKKRVEFTDEDQKLQIIHRNHISIMRQPLQIEHKKSDKRISYTTDRKIFGPEFRTSLFIVTSLVYAMILIVVCIAYVISDVTTHRLPILYYEGFFTYLYGASILFLLYVFCFLLQESFGRKKKPYEGIEMDDIESSCCNGNSKPKPPPKQKKEKKQKPKKGEQPSDSKDGGNGGKGGSTKDSGKGGKPSPFQEKFPKKKRDLYREQLLLLNQDSQVEAEAAVTPKNIRKRKTTQDDHTTGSFFLRVGAIAFGLGAMIYVGLEFGSFFEIPFTSKCHFILSGVNPLLQMVFIFMQMYFIFMNARLNIHRFKVLARFGLMHVVATNICVWIRTLVKESLHEITIYHQRNIPSGENSPISQSIRRHALRYAGEVMKTHIGPNSEFEIFDSEPIPEAKTNEDGILSRIIKTTADTIAPLLAQATSDATTHRNNPITSTTSMPTTTSTTEYSIPSTTMIQKIKKFISTTTMATSTFPSTTTTTTTEAPTSIFESSSTSGNDLLNQPAGGIASFVSSFSSPQPNDVSTTTTEGFVLNNLFGNMENSFQTLSRLSQDETAMETYDNFDNIYPAALTSNIGVINSTACGRIDIMGTIVYDSAPYLYPFIIEYSLIGAVVLYVMWKHIGRYPRYMNEEDLEHRLEVMLSRRAVAMAQQARTGRVDCVGSSKGLFFGLLLLVGSMICLILFFVLVRHSKFELLAIYLADISHCTLMVFAILAIVIGFIRVKNLKFRCEEQSSLNDILLRISAFGLFIYSVFSVIAGSLKFLESEPNLLVMATGIIAVVQVIFQLLFIADVSRRRVHLPEHDRSKPGRQIVTFLLICNVSMFAIYTFEAQRVALNTVQLDFYGFVPWSIIQRVTLPLCIFHRFHSAVTLAEIWKTTYKARLE